MGLEIDSRLLLGRKRRRRRKKGVAMASICNRNERGAGFKGRGGAPQNMTHFSFGSDSDSAASGFLPWADWWKEEEREERVPVIELLLLLLYFFSGCVFFQFSTPPRSTLLAEHASAFSQNHLSR